MKEILDFDEMYSIQCSDSLTENFYQVYCELGFNRMMEQIKTEREYLINELVTVNFTQVLDYSNLVLDNLEELKMTNRHEILEEL